MHTKRTLSFLTAGISLLICATVTYAGSLTPSASPAATSYTLTDIYTRLTTNATATEGVHDFAPSGAPAGSMYTLTQVYTAIPTIEATQVKYGTAYLGITGALLPNGGTATTAAVFTGATVHLSGDWALDTGLLTLACATATFDGTANKVANAYDGAGDGTNRFCMTDSGDATAGDILSGKIAWIDGSAVTGTIATRTLSAANDTVSAGYYAATTLSAVDADLATGNIKSGVTVFGIAGNSNVVNTTTGDAVAGEILSGKKAWVDGLEITGTITDREGDNASTAQVAAAGLNYLTAPAGFYDGDDRVSATDAQIAALDGDIVTGNIKSGVTVFGVAGSGYVVSTGGVNAAAGDLLSGKTAYVLGSKVTGTMAAGYTYGSNSGYYVLGTATAPGTALVNLWNGTRTDGGFPGGSQANGGVDDYNNAKAPASDRYVGPAGWTACNVGNTYCGTGDSGADAMDNSTGLVWSLPCNGSACASFSDASPLTYSWDSFHVNNGGRTASQLCSDHSGWSLPHQKQLMQAYIDGSYGNLEASGVSRTHWSATTRSASTTNAWYVPLSNGYTVYDGKTVAFYVRCVRPAM